PVYWHKSGLSRVSRKTCFLTVYSEIFSRHFIPIRILFPAAYLAIPSQSRSPSTGDLVLDDLPPTKYLLNQRLVNWAISQFRVLFHWKFVCYLLFQPFTVAFFEV